MFIYGQYRVSLNLYIGKVGKWDSWRMAERSEALRWGGGFLFSSGFESCFRQIFIWTDFCFFHSVQQFCNNTSLKYFGRIENSKQLCLRLLVNEKNNTLFKIIIQNISPILIQLYRFIFYRNQLHFAEA